MSPCSFGTGACEMSRIGGGARLLRRAARHAPAASGEHESVHDVGKPRIHPRVLSIRPAIRSASTRVSNWTRALCVRIPEGQRMASEQDCRGCTFWEPADTHDS